MKPLHTLSLIAALCIAGCATQPATTVVPAVAAAVSPTPGIISAGRLVPADIDRLVGAGVRQIIDLTPDAETPEFDEASAARAAGIAYSNLPLRGGQDLTRANVIAFDKLLRAARHPVLVHCSSGNRVGAMAALRAAWVEAVPVEEAIAIGKMWGLKGLESDVRHKIGSATRPVAP